MAAVAITAQNTRLDDAEATGTVWGNDGGGAGAGVESDYKYQGSNCISRKGASGSRGIYLSDNVNTDLTGTGTYQTVMFKFICTTPGLLSAVSVPGMQLRIGSGSTQTTASSNYYSYNVQGNDTYPVDKSWLVLPVDPNIASHRDGTTGSPGLTVCDYYALQYDQTAVSKAENQAMDAVDIGAGLTLTGGDGADADGTWQDFSDHDWGTSGNRFGYVREAEGTYIVYGDMIIGTATATVFTDKLQTVIFPDGRFAAGFSGITVDLQNATTAVNWDAIAHFSNGTAAGEDTRAILTVTGTNGTFDALTCSFTKFASVTLTSAATMTDCVFTQCGLIDAGSGANLAGSSILESTVAANASALEWDVNLDPDGELNNMTFTKGTNAHHAIEFGTNIPSEITLRGCDFTGFSASQNVNDSMFHFKDTAGTITVNLVNCTADVAFATSYRTDGATIVIVEDPVTLTVNTLDDQGTPIASARVYVRAAGTEVASPTVEWLFDEASSGSSPTTVASTVGGHDLTIAYDSGNAAWTSVSQGNGLDFTGTPATTDAKCTLSDLSAEFGPSFSNIKTLTCLFALRADAGDSLDCRIVYLGPSNGNGDFAVCLDENEDIQVRWDDDTGTGGRVTFTDSPASGSYYAFAARIDTNESTLANRCRLWSYNGTSVTEHTTQVETGELAQNETIDLNNANYHVGIGGMLSTNQRNPDGAIFYVSLYNTALSVDAIAELLPAVYNLNDSTPVVFVSPLPLRDSVTITRSATTASVVHTAHGLSNSQKVRIEGCTQAEYNGIKTISNVSTNGYDYTVSGSPATPATGTPQSTAVIISGLSNGSGVASDTRTYVEDQLITGWARKSTTSPYYKQGAISGTISATTGLTTNAVMIPDE